MNIIDTFLQFILKRERDHKEAIRQIERIYNNCFNGFSFKFQLKNIIFALPNNVGFCILSLKFEIVCSELNIRLTIQNIEHRIDNFTGVWRSWLACWSGGPEVVSSSLTTPTNLKTSVRQAWAFFYFPPHA